MSTIAQFEIIVPFTTWARALTPMLSNRALVATGALIRDPTRDPVGLLVEELRVSAKPPTGGDFPPLGDWLAVAVMNNDARDTPEAWIRRLEPRFAQMLVILLIGTGQKRGQWRGWTVERGASRALAGLRIVGPGMVQARAAGFDDFHDESDPERWMRLAGALGERVFAKVRRAAVSVIGCSRNGNLCAASLASLGVRKLTLVDGAILRSHHLDAFILASERDCGNNKAIVLGQRLESFRSDLAISAHPKPLDSSMAATVFDGADFAVTCADQNGDGARLITAHEAKSRLIPHLDIGTGVTRTALGERQIAADVRLLLPGAGCIRCVGGVSDLDQAEYELYAVPGALPRRPPLPWDARGRLGSRITINSIACSCGIESWLDLLEGTLAGSIWHRLRWQPGRALEVHSGLVAAGTGCKLCGMKKDAD